MSTLPDSPVSFAHQDLRGRSFKNAVLHAVLFHQTICGITPQQFFLNFLPNFIVGSLASFLMIISGAVIPSLINELAIHLPTLSHSLWFVSLGGFLSLGYTVVLWQSLYHNWLLGIGNAAFVIFIIFMIEILLPTTYGSGIGSVGASIAIVVAIALAESIALLAIDVVAVIITLISIIGIIDIIKDESRLPVTLAFLMSITIFLISSVIMSWRTLHKEDSELNFLRVIAINFRSWGGTNFSHADLTEADFSGANLDRTRFNDARLWRTNFRGARNLKFAHLKNTILSQRAVRELLVSGNGEKQSYAGMDLTGAYLRGANLAHADLSQAVLLGADLRGAVLTGVRLDNWLIDTETLLDDIECRYVFLDNNRREPPEGEFKPGEFTKLFQQIAKALEFIVENKIELHALLRAAQHLREQGTDITLNSIENKQDSAKVTFTAPPEVDRDALYREMKRSQELQMKLMVAETKIQLLENQSDKFETLLEKVVTKPLFIENNTENYVMSNQHTQTISHSHIVGSTLNLGEISGQVQNTVEQLAATTPEQLNLKETLQRLYKLLNNTTELTEDDKAEALKMLQNIAVAAENPESGKALVKTALRFFKGLIAELEKDAQQLAVELVELIKQVGAFFMISIFL